MPVSYVLRDNTDVTIGNTFLYTSQLSLIEVFFSPARLIKNCNDLKYTFVFFQLSQHFPEKFQNKIYLHLFALHILKEVIFCDLVNFDLLLIVFLNSGF